MIAVSKTAFRLARLVACGAASLATQGDVGLYAQVATAPIGPGVQAWPNAAAYTAAAQATQLSPRPQAGAAWPREAPAWPQQYATVAAVPAAYQPDVASPSDGRPASPEGLATDEIGGDAGAADNDDLQGSSRAENDAAAGTANDAERSAGDLQKEIDDLKKELETLNDDFSSFSDKNFVYTGSSNSSMKFGGRIHLDSWGFANDNGVVDGPGFEGIDPQNRLIVRRLRLTVQGDVRENMIYKMDLEVSEPNDASFRDAYIGFEELPVLQTVIIGNHKRPYGLDHINSSNVNVFLERPFVVEAFNEDNRRLGVSSNGFSEDLRYNWRYGVFNQEVVQDSGQYIGDPLQLELAGRLAATPWYDEISDGRGYLHLAIAGTAADPNPDDAFATNSARFRTRPEARSTNRWIDTGRIAGAENYELLGLESVLNVGAFQLVSEYQTLQVNRDSGLNDVSFDGYYVYAAYFLTGEHMPWDRESGQLDPVVPFENFWAVDRCCGGRSAGWGAWQVAARYSEADLTDDDIFGGVGEAVTLGLNWYWNTNARMQFNYVDGQIGERTAAQLEGDYQIYGVRSMLFF